MPAELNLQHVDVPPNTVLSDLDKAYAILNYPGLKASPAQPSGWTISHALDVAGVTGSSRDKILQSTDPLEIRRLLFSRNAAQKNKVNNGEYTGGTNSSTATNTSANTIVPVTGSKPSGLIGRIEGILKEAKVPTATVDTVNAALKKELALLSQSVAKHVLDG